MSTNSKGGGAASLDGLAIGGPRTAKSLQAYVDVLTDGDTFMAGGLTYLIDSTAMGGASAAQDLGVDGVVPSGQWYFEHFGAQLFPEDCTAHCRRAIAATILGRHIMFATTGPYLTTDTIFTKKDDMVISGPNGAQTDIKYINSARGIVIAGDELGPLSMATYLRNKIYGIRILSVDASTDAQTLIDFTSFSHGHFDIGGQSKRRNAVLMRGQGNNGAAPYFNNIYLGDNFGGGARPSDYSQTVLQFAKGLWDGGSDGPNANNIHTTGRVAAVDCIFDFKSGTGNIIHSLGGESVRSAYIKLNVNPAVDSGISPGSYSSLTFIDSSKAWGTNVYSNDAIKITSGRGAGQVRIISTNTGNSLNLKGEWGVVPDNTSTYELYEGKVSGNQILSGRAEGLASLNPNYIHAYAGTQRMHVSNIEAQSLGAGLFIRDDSGSTTNKWFNSSSIFSHTFLNVGPSANLNAVPRQSVFGGMRLGQDYVVNWLKTNISYTGQGDALDVTLDAGGALTGGGTVSLLAQVPTSGNAALALPDEDKKIIMNAKNNALHVNVKTGPNFIKNRHVIVTYSISLA